MFVFALLLFSLSSSSGQVFSSSPDSPIKVKQYRGDWWQSAQTDERQGFLAGVDECLNYDVHKRLWFIEPLGYYEQAVTHFYKEHPRNSHVLVFEVVRDKLSIKKRPIEERMPEYGSEWWSKASNGARRGFIEGPHVVPSGVKARDSLEYRGR
jgi:hypothetical protein